MHSAKDDRVRLAERRYVPDLRHWQALAEVAGVDVANLPAQESEPDANLYEKCADDALGELARSEPDVVVDERTGEVVGEAAHR